MRQDMEFAAGVQWPGQDSIDSDRYVANLTNRHKCLRLIVQYREHNFGSVNRFTTPNSASNDASTFR